MSTSFLTVPEVAELLRVSPRPVYDWVSQRRIPFRKAGRHTIFDREEILRWTEVEAGKLKQAVHLLTSGEIVCAEKSQRAISTTLRGDVTCRKCLRRAPRP